MSSRSLNMQIVRVGSNLLSCAILVPKWCKYCKLVNSIYTIELSTNCKSNVVRLLETCTLNYNKKIIPILLPVFFLANLCYRDLLHPPRLLLTSRLPHAYMPGALSVRPAGPMSAADRKKKIPTRVHMLRSHVRARHFQLAHDPLHVTLSSGHWKEKKKTSR